MIAAAYTDQQLPYDHDAEASLLGAVLIDATTIVAVSDIITPLDFHRARNQFCYEACLELFISGVSIDPITVGRALAQHQRLESVGGLPYLGELISRTPTSVNAVHYANIVAETANLRRLLDASSHIAELATSPETSFDHALKSAIDSLHSLRTNNRRRGLRPLRDELDQFLQDPTNNLPENNRMVPTGFNSLDGIITAFQPGNLVILGARPSMGKTSLALNFVNAASAQGRTSAIFSMEMASPQIVLRLVSGHSRISAHRLRSGLYTEHEESEMIHTIGVLSDRPIWIDDTGAYTVADIRAQLSRLQLFNPLDLVVIDYLQLIRPDHQNYRHNNVQDMTQISRTLKELAVTSQIPVIACSQLSRAPEIRADHHPVMSDLRESGSIEQDADVVMLLYRADRYYTVNQWNQAYPGTTYPLNIAELNVAKHRNGPTGSVSLYFDPNTMQFFEADQRHPPDTD